jgi:hypothetical protein
MTDAETKRRALVMAAAEITKLAQAEMTLRDLARNRLDMNTAVMHGDRAGAFAEAALMLTRMARMMA